jgi:hypothetical protein
MSLVTCGGADVMRGRIILPSFGNWCADLAVDTALAPTGSIVIAAAGGIELHGTVLDDRTAVHLDVCYLRVVGGAGGLGKDVSGAYQRAQLRDPLNAIMKTTGEKLSTKVSDGVLGVSLNLWTLGRCRAARALDDLAAAAAKALGQTIRWRVLDDGTVWIGAETWPTVSMQTADVIVDVIPAERRVELGVETLTLLPGVHLDEVGKVAAVEHWIRPDKMRTWAWQA